MLTDTSTRRAAERPNREGWLGQGARRLAALVEERAGVKVPVAHLSVGFPSGAHADRELGGQCFKGEFSKDGKPHIFVRPQEDDAMAVLVIVLHQQIHMVAGPGHRGDFLKVARAVGFIKPWAKARPTAELELRLEAIKRALGRYPHAALVPPPKETGAGRPRWECPCGIAVEPKVKPEEYLATCNRCGGIYARKRR